MLLDSSFMQKEKKDLAQLSKTSPRQFWNYINKSKKKPSQQIFAQYFESFSKQGSNSDSSSGQNVTYTVNIDELDKSITILEVEKVAKCFPRPYTEKKTLFPGPNGPL